MDLYIYQKGKKEQLENFRKHISRIINNDPYMIEDILLGRWINDNFIRKIYWEQGREFEFQ